MPFARVWRFRVSSHAAAEFERVYGPNGEWTTLFSRGEGYRGTTLEKIPGATNEFRLVDSIYEFRLVDRWTSREAWNAFRRAFAEEYEELDLWCEGLTLEEELLEEIEFVE